MSKIELSDVTTLTNETSFLSTTNTNNDAIETASDLFLSRDGTAPNSMEADLDMNSFPIINLPAPSSATEPLRLQDLSDFLGSGTVVTGAPVSASYLTLGTNSTLTSERVLTAGTNISFTDNGAGNTLVVNATSGSSGAALTKVDDTNVTLTLAGSPTTALVNATSITAGWTGTLAASRGGTGVSSLGSGVATWLGTPSSANLAAALTDETGSGAAVFATSPTLVTPALGTPSSGNLTNCTGIPTGTTGAVIMYPAVGQGSGAWKVFDPYGTAVSTGGTTSQGLQEAINYAVNNGYSLEVYGQAAHIIGTRSGSTTNANAVVTGLSQTSDLLVGDWVTCATGLQSFTQIQSIDSSSQVTLNKNATATGSRSLKFTRGAGANLLNYIASSATITVPPAEQWNAKFYNVNVTFDTTVNGPGFSFDSLMIVDWDFQGQVVYRPGTPTGNSVAINVAPINPVPVDGIITVTDTKIRFSNIACVGAASTEACWAFDATNTIANNHFQAFELNGASTTLYGYKVFAPGASTAFEQNTIEATHIHLNTSAGVQVGVNTTNASNLRHNVWRIGGIKPSGGSATGFNTFGSYDVVDIGAITNEEGTLNQGLVFQTSAVKNQLQIGQILGAGTSIVDNATTNVVITDGNLRIPTISLQPTTAIPAGGTAGAGYLLSSTANFGIFFGSGAPSLSAAKGSLYLRSDGTTTNNRAYINTNGSTTWTNITTAA